MCLGPYIEHDHTNEDAHISGYFLYNLNQLNILQG